MQDGACLHMVNMSTDDGTAVKFDGETVGSVTAGRKRAAVMNDWVFL